MLFLPIFDNFYCCVTFSGNFNNFKKNQIIKFKKKYSRLSYKYSINPDFLDTVYSHNEMLDLNSCGPDLGVSIVDGVNFIETILCNLFVIGYY